MGDKLGVAKEEKLFPLQDIDLNIVDKSAALASTSEFFLDQRHVNASLLKKKPVQESKMKSSPPQITGITNGNAASRNDKTAVMCIQPRWRIFRILLRR